MRPEWLLALLLCGFALPGMASEDPPRVEVVGRFQDRVVLLINGERHILSPGQRSPEGVVLKQVRDDGAMVEIAGQERFVRMGAVLRPSSADDRGAQSPRVDIYRDNRGMFNTVGSINGLPVPFLVDTGATNIAMNAAMARRLGIDYRLQGRQSWVQTASGVEPVYQVNLERVKVGEIELRNIAAVVLEGEQPARTLLGMSFLKRLEMINRGDRLTLRKNY